MHAMQKPKILKWSEFRFTHPIFLPVNQLAKPNKMRSDLQKQWNRRKSNWLICVLYHICRFRIKIMEIQFERERDYSVGRRHDVETWTTSSLSLWVSVWVWVGGEMRKPSTQLWTTHSIFDLQQFSQPLSTTHPFIFLFKFPIFVIYTKSNIKNVGRGRKNRLCW